MNRLTKVVLGTTAAVALTAANISPAAASEKYPAKNGWQYQDITDVIAAGYACDKAVRLTIKGHYKIIEKSPTRTINKSAADFRMSLKNLETGKTIKRDISGDFDDRLINGGRDIKTYATGKNLYLGRGVTGLVWADKKQTVFFYDFQDPALGYVAIDSTRGRTEELCRQVGLRAVPGQNDLIGEGPSTASARMARR